MKKKKKGRFVGERKIEMRKKGIDMGKREEINEKIAPISQIFPLLNYSPLLH